MTHVDLVKMEWSAGYGELVRRIPWPSDDPLATARGDYLFATDPHEDEDCPFGDATRIPLRPVAHF